MIVCQFLIIFFGLQFNQITLLQDFSIPVNTFLPIRYSQIYYYKRALYE